MVATKTLAVDRSLKLKWDNDSGVWIWTTLCCNKHDDAGTLVGLSANATDDQILEAFQTQVCRDWIDFHTKDALQIRR